MNILLRLAYIPKVLRKSSLSLTTAHSLDVVSNRNLSGTKEQKYVLTLRSLQLPLLILRQASCTCHTQHSKFDHDFFDFKNLNRRVGHLCCQETENWSTIPIVKQKPWRRCTLLHPSYRSNWRSMDINKIV